MNEYEVTVQVSYEVYMTIDADNEEEAKEAVSAQAQDAGLVSNYVYNVIEEPTIVSVEEGGQDG